MKHLHLIFFTAIALSSLSNAEIYRWVDSNGNVQYSDKEPENQDYEKKTYHSASPTIDPELDKYRKHIKSNELERKRTKALADQKAAENIEKAKKKKKYCDQLKAKIHIDHNAVGWQTRHPDGSATPWTGEQRIQYTKKLNDNFKKYCQ